MLNLITNNPYRTLGVLSNSPLRDRVGNQNRLAAYAKVGKVVSFPLDFTTIIPKKPERTSECISAANTAVNLDRDQIKFSLFWFINGSPIDDIAIKYLQSGNIDKAKELFQKKESYSSLINGAVIAFIENDITLGLTNISKVIHNATLRSELFAALDIQNPLITEEDIAAMFIGELLEEVPAKKLLESATNPNDKAIISRRALEKPISEINSAIETAKAADSNNANASLAAGTQLMNLTQNTLKQVREIAGAMSPQYQMVADSLAKQILQCGINYYNNAPDSDVESPRKAMVLQEYALKIAVGKLTKDRCQENYDILKKNVDNMPPAEVAIETRKVKEELRKFCQLPDKIIHSITLLNNTKPLLQTVKAKLGVTNAFYLSLSTQVVGNALHNVIEEVNSAQNAFGRTIEQIKSRGINPVLLGSTLLDTIMPVMTQAWNAIMLMDSFDMATDFKSIRYNPNRQSLKEMCESLKISTTTSIFHSTPRPSTTQPTTSTSRPTMSKTSTSPTKTSSDMDSGCLSMIIFAIVGSIIIICGAIS